jgi:hypothetical protein
MNVVRMGDEQLLRHSGESETRASSRKVYREGSENKSGIFPIYFAPGCDIMYEERGAHAPLLFV